MENTQLNETENEATVQTQADTGSKAADKLKKLNPKTKLAVIIAAVIVVIILFAVIASNASYIKISLDELCQIRYSGINGKGTAAAHIDFSELNKMAETSTGINFGFAAFEETFKAEVTPDSELSNGDKVTLKFTYDESLAKKYKIKVSPKTLTEKVEDLPEADDVNPFDNLEVSFSGTSPFGKINIDDTGCHDFVKNYVRFTYDNDIKIENGASIKITAEYDQSNADNKLVNITETEREYTVEGLGEYISDTAGVDLSLIEQELSDKIISKVSKAKKKDSILGRINFANISLKVSSDVNYKDLKATERYIAYAKKPTSYGTCNKLYTVYEITALEEDGTETKIYFYTTVENIIKQPDGSITWDSSIDMDATTSSTDIANDINSIKDEYTVKEADLSSVIIPAL